MSRTNNDKSVEDLVNTIYKVMNGKKNIVPH